MKRLVRSLHIAPRLLQRAQSRNGAGRGNLTTALPGVENAPQWKTILMLKVHRVCAISRVMGCRHAGKQASRSRRGFETKAADSAFTSFLRGSGCRVTQELIPTSQV